MIPGKSLVLEKIPAANSHFIFFFLNTTIP